MLTARQQIVIKQEANAGTAETLAAANVVLHTGIAEFEPDVQMTPREAMTASLSKRGQVVGAKAGKIRWKQYLRGTSVAPVQDTTFPDFRVPFLGCGVKDTVSGVNPNEQTSFKPSTTLVEDLTTGACCTVGLYEDGKRYLLTGAVGNCVLTFVMGVPTLAEFEFTGALSGPAPTDTALLVPTYPTIVEPPFLGAALSILGYTSAHIRQITLDFGNKITLVPDPNSLTSGYAFAQITDRAPVGTFDAEEVLAATKNYWNEWLSGTTGLITTGVFPSNGTNYNQLQLNVPKAAYVKTGLGDRDGMANVPIDYECRANSDAGEDEWELIQT